MVKRKTNPTGGSWNEWEGAAAPGNGFEMSEKQLGKLHDAIFQTAKMVVRDIAHLEQQKSEADLTNRIVKSAYKAASDPKLLQMPREAAISELVTRMMTGGYSAAFSEAPWFFSINLPPVLCAAAWEIFSASGCFDGNHWELQDMVVFEFDAQLDQVLLDRAMWEVARAVFGEETTQNKIFQAISRSYWPAMEEVLGNVIAEEQLYGWVTPDKELQAVQAFASKWINDAMCRAWVSVEGAEQVLTPDAVLQLFQGLVEPYGPEDPFTCIPKALTETIGRPPADWPHLNHAISELFANWAGGGHSFGGGKKRKKAANPWSSDGSDWQAEQKRSWQPSPKAAPPTNAPGAAKAKFRGFGAKEELLENEGNGGAEGGGHPLCTSDEDCIGSPDLKLVQHILKGNPGDMYCQKCWDSFSARNASLQGVEVDL